MSGAFGTVRDSAVITTKARPNTSSKQPVGPGFVQHTTDSNRQKRRALINALGKRQFKKLYRKAQA